MSSLYTPSQLLTFKTLCSIIPPVVGLLTGLRLWIKQPRRWWFDDMFVTVGVCAMITQQAVLWSRSIYEPPTLPIFYAVVCLSQTQVWLARFSILSSVVRIVPSPSSRIFTPAVFALFLVMYLVVLAQIVWVCQTNLRYVGGGIPTCVFTLQLPIYQFTAAMFADLFLCVLPIRTIMRIKGDRSLRQRLIFIFAASLATTTVTFVQAVLNILDITFGVLITAELECWISLLVCNFGVLLTAFVRWISPPPTSSGNIEFSMLKFASTSPSSRDEQASANIENPKPLEILREYSKEGDYSPASESADSKFPTVV